MNYLNQGLLLYMFGPPLLALAFCGLMYLGSRKRTQQLDADIAAFRAKVKAERTVAAAADDAEEQRRAA